jgi:hypothetical protein
VCCRPGPSRATTISARSYNVWQAIESSRLYVGAGNNAEFFDRGSDFDSLNVYKFKETLDQQ